MKVFDGGEDVGISALDVLNTFHDVGLSHRVLV